MLRDANSLDLQEILQYILQYKTVKGSYVEIVLRGATQLSEQVWEMTLETDELSVFGRPAQRAGDVTVVLVNGPVRTDNSAIRFDHRKGQILNLGKGDHVIFVTEKESAMADHDGPVLNSGDQRFLNDLERVPQLREVGRRLLADVRSRSAGGLTYKERSRKFVEGPDNFWTVKIQPRDRSLRVTVRGRPSNFPAPGLNLVNDMAGYSAFKVKAAGEVDEAVQTILRARR